LALPQPFTAFDAMMHEAQGELTAEQAEAIYKEERALERVVEARLADAAAAGQIRTADPVLVAHAYLALLRVGQSGWAAGGRLFPDCARTAAVLVATLWDGIGPASNRL
jgi:hypothetical protein